SPKHVLAIAPRRAPAPYSNTIEGVVLNVNGVMLMLFGYATFYCEFDTAVLAGVFTPCAAQCKPRVRVAERDYCKC
ncbi:MAG: hypothetical protein ACI8W7_001921, partial [Gammaproteobacteria bacterium]